MLTLGEVVTIAEDGPGSASSDSEESGRLTLQGCCWFCELLGIAI